MAIFKCKMCGGSLEIAENVAVTECEYCGSKQTVPTEKDEFITNLFNRANNLRLKNEFDKAAEIYNKILNEKDTDAEAHWGIVLCKYGVEYVEDPKTYKRIPTCHRTQYTSVLSDTDYLAAIENSDAVSKDVYTSQAHEIAELQKSILAIVKNEKPFDVFICYKETDENGKRTVDSALANDIYYQLTKEGLRVFFAAITLEDKLGVEYEPYIFAALNSAKVMLVIGTKIEYFNAVWVKNEWSRYLGIMKNDREKMLIPCYRDIDAYDLPEEFAHLQAQDMSKIGFINDLVRGIAKVTSKKESKPEVIRETVVTEGNANTTALLKRVFMFLEDGEWQNANEYCEKVLDIDPECAEAYLGKLMVVLRVNKRENLKNCPETFSDKNYYQKAIRFADEALRKELESYIDFIINKKSEALYTEATRMMNSSKSVYDFRAAAEKFNALKDFKDFESKAKLCLEEAETALLNSKYRNALSDMEKAETEQNFKDAAAKFNAIKTYKDSESKAKLCLEKAAKAKAEAERRAEEERIENERRAEEERIEAERRAEEQRIEAERLAEEKRIADEKAKAESEARAKKNKTIGAIVASTVAVVLAVVIVFTTVIIPNGKYDDAVALMEAGKYEEAVSAFEELDGHKDSNDKINKCNMAIIDAKYNTATALISEKKYEEAMAILEELDEHKDSDDKINECNMAIFDAKYNTAMTLISEKKHEEAIAIFEELDGYKASDDRKTQATYEYALLLFKQGKHNEAYKKFTAVADYKEADEYLKNFCYVPVIVKSSGSSRDEVTYRFSYNKNGLLSEVVSDRFGNNVYSFDKSGKVVKATHYDQDYTKYTYKNDGSILTEHFSKKSGKKISSDLYNSHGNRIAYYSFTDNAWINFEYDTYDKFHNRTNSVENTYDENNNLISVYCKINYFWTKSTIEYEYLYFENTNIDKDLAWRNLRIICEESLY